MGPLKLHHGSFGVPSEPLGSQGAPSEAPSGTLGGRMNPSWGFANPHLGTSEAPLKGLGSRNSIGSFLHFTERAE